MKFVNRFLIVKTGETFPSLALRRGDFDDWIIARLGIDRQTIDVVRPYAGEPLPDPDRISGALITGSHAMVTDHADWSETVAAWIPGVIRADIPLLGICYGHQLLAHAMGGRIGMNRSGSEFGTVEIQLTPEAARDPLFKNLPGRLPVQTSHSQSVLSLPPGAVLLASSAHDPHHAFAISETAWGIQFHPEFDADITGAYIHECADMLRREGQNPGRLFNRISETPVSENILKYFGVRV